MDHRVVSSDARAVLLHGFTGSSRAWGDDALEGLVAAGVQPAPLDLPGHGARRHEVAGSEYGLEAVMASVDRAVGSAGRDPGSRPALLGYSMGGRLALHYAVRHPDRISALILESTSPGLATESQRAQRRVEDERLARALETRGIEAFVEHWASLPLFSSRQGLPHQVQASVRTGQLANEPSALAASLRGLGTGALPPLWDRLRKILVPTLVVVGALDAKFLEIGRRMVERLPRARLVVVPHCGHTVHLEHPGTWADVVGAFVARHALERQGPPG